MSKTVADASRDYRQRQRKKLVELEGALRAMVDCADDVQEISGGTKQHEALHKATLNALKVLGY